MRSNDRGIIVDKMMSLEKVWQERFSKQAIKGKTDHQKMWYASSSQQQEHLKLVLWIIRKSGLKRRATLLEAGCGTGFYIKELLKLKEVDSIVGLDMSLTMLRTTAKESRIAECKLIQSMISSLPLAECIIDGVVCMSVLQTVEDHKKAIMELCRVLKPGGFLIASTLRQYSIWELACVLPWLFMADSPGGRKEKTIYNLIKSRKTLIWDELPEGYPPKMYKYSELRNILKDNGMQDIKCYYPGRIRYLPFLWNSFNMIFFARKA